MAAGKPGNHHHGGSGLPVYHGKFGEREAARLLWRAGFGPKPGEAAKLARRFNLKGAVHSLTRPKGKERLKGPTPVDGDGLPLAPFDAYGHDLLWWLDRMVRTNHPMVERMALIWHDWFATADVNSQQLSIEQAQLFERRWMAPFPDLLLEVTSNPAMLIWLSGLDNTRRAPNENYAREMMELFTLGASDDSGFPYSEDDVREQARALTGWDADWEDDVGYVNFHFDPKRHDTGSKTIFGQSGNFDWTDSCRLCVTHSAHKTFFVKKLWSYFIPVPPNAKTRKALRAPLREERLRRSPGGRGDPHAPDLLPRPGDGEAAGRLYRRPAAVSSARRAERLVVDVRPRRATALPASERRRVGRRPLARHLDVSRPLDRGQRDRRL